MATETTAEPRFYLADLQALSTSGNLAVTFKSGTDFFQVNGPEFAISFMAQDGAPVDPRLVLKDDKGFPYLARSDLKELPGVTDGGGPAVFRIEQRGSHGARTKLLNWEGLQKLCSQTIGRDVAALPPDTSFHALLAASGVIDPAFLDVADRARDDDETIGQALLRLELCTPRDLVFAAMGSARLFNPTCNMANAIGQILIEKGTIPKAMLKRALDQQVRGGGSLAKILLELGCSRQALAGGARALKDWPLASSEADKTTEVLIRHGSLSRTELLSSALQIQSSGGSLKDHLIAAHLCSPHAIAQAEAWHDLKLRLRTAGRIRLGEILIAHKALKPADLLATLKEQISSQDPLGELLMASGRATPEAVIAALREQEDELDRLVAAAVAGTDHGVVANLPLFDLPPLKASPNKRAKTGTKPRSKARKRQGQARRRLPKGKTLIAATLLAIALPAMAFAGVRLASAVQGIRSSNARRLVLAAQPHRASRSGGRDLPTGDGSPSDRAEALGESGSPTGDDRQAFKAPLANLSNADLKKIVANNPIAYTDPKDIEQNSDRIQEVLTQAAKHDPRLAAALKLARESSGADIAERELAAVRNNAAPAQPGEPAGAGGPHGAAPPSSPPLESGGGNLVQQEWKLVADLKTNQMLLQAAQNSRALLFDELGQVLYVRRDYPNAVAEFRQSLRLNGNSADPHFDLGRTLLAQRKIRQAASELKLALRLAPKGPHAREIQFLLARKGLRR